MTTGPITQVQQDLFAFDRAPDLRRLRAASALLSTVNLLAPEDPADRLTRRSQTLALWLSLLARLDNFVEALAATAPDDTLSASARNRLLWQADATDREVTEYALDFVQKYYTSSPIDRAELMLAIASSNFREARRAGLLI